MRTASADERGQLLDGLAIDAARGQAEALTTLVWAIRHFSLATPAIRQYLFRAEDIDAAEQQALVAVAERITSFRGDSRFTTWLHRVAANEAKQVVRSEARHRDRAAPLGLDDRSEHLVQRISSMVVDQALVQGEIDRLPDRLRRALMLRERDGLTYEEIARTLEVPVGTAKTWVRRGRMALAAGLADQVRPTE